MLVINGDFIDKGRLLTSKHFEQGYTLDNRISIFEKCTIGTKNIILLPSHNFYLT